MKLKPSHILLIAIGVLGAGMKYEADRVRHIQPDIFSDLAAGAGSAAFAACLRNRSSRDLAEALSRPSGNDLSPNA